MQSIKKDGRGGVRPGAGRKKTPHRTLRDAIDNINVQEIVKRLEAWSTGKEVVCPYCNKNTGAYTADTVSLQSAIELLNRRLGKPVQRQEIDVTSHIQLDADQVNKLLKDRFGITIDDVRQVVEQKQLASGTTHNSYSAK